MPVLTVIACPSCGARSIDPEGVCEYCKTRVVTSLSTAMDGSNKSESVEVNPSIHRQHQILDAEREMRFLEEQFKETAHPSLPQKIKRAKERLEHYKHMSGSKK